MRLKSFTARSMKEAIGMVRAELGPDAVIVSTVQSRAGGGSVRITAAVEQGEERGPGLQAPAAKATGFERITEAARCALEDHGTPEPITARLIAAAKVLKGEEPRLALAAALDDCFRFAPIPEEDFTAPFILVGPPGVGKTIATAKIAARARLRDEPVTVISADTERAGGVEQIANLTRIMRANFRAVADPQEMRAAVGDCHVGELTVIDSAGTNPFSETEMGALGDLVTAARAEPILVLNAGGDSVEYGEIASSFAAIGATRLLVTRIDMARRMGSILAAADAGRLKFCNVSTTPNVGKGFSALNPVSLARVLLPEAVAPALRQESIA